MLDTVVDIDNSMQEMINSGRNTYDIKKMIALAEFRDKLKNEEMKMIIEFMEEIEGNLSSKRRKYWKRFLHN